MVRSYGLLHVNLNVRGLMRSTFLYTFHHSTRGIMRNSKPGWRVLFLLIAWMAMAQSVISDERTTQLFGGDSLRSAADYLKDRNGHAMLVYHRDKLVFEEYFNGWSADKPHRLASGTKSFSGAMLAAAVEDGLLKLDEKVADTIVEWKDDARKSQITIRHFLSLTSGIYGGSTREASPSCARGVIIAGAKFWPGQRFQYGPIPYQVFGELMRRKLAEKNESVEAYL